MSSLSLSLLVEPKLANVREWTDKSGTFKTEAEYLGIEDGKVMLHKLNGVKIGVPLDKLDQRDIDFLSKMPGNNHLLAKYSSSATYTSSSSNFMPIPLAKPARGPELSSAALLEAGTASDASQSQYTYGGFDWKSWLIAANISPADASSYALKFVGEKMDKLSLADMERDVLRALGVAEGDIIRIRKAIGHMPGIGVSAVVASKINDRENQALGRNLQMLNSMKLVNQH